MTEGSWLSGPLRMSMILAAEGKHKEASAMFERHLAETKERLKATPPEPRPETHDDG